MSRIQGLCCSVLTLVAIVVASAGTAGCFGRDGDGLVRTQEYKAADGTFQLTYAAPPWELANNGSNSARLEIGLEFFGIDIGGALPPSHIVLATKIDVEESLEDLIGIDEIKKIAEDNGFDLDDVGLNDELDELPDELGSETMGLPTDGEISTGSDDMDDGTGDSGISEIVEYLEGIDINNPRDVAVAEMEFLIDNQDAELITGLREFRTDSGHMGVEYQLFIPPAVHARNFYMETSEAALRVSFLSIFDLETPDIEVMVSALSTNVAPQAPPFAAEESGGSSEEN